jgi:hypothetical protein
MKMKDDDEIGVHCTHGRYEGRVKFDMKNLKKKISWERWV